MYHFGGYESYKMGTLDNGGCSFNGEIKTWFPFRESVCHECDVKGLGWIYESVNVFSGYLQKLVVAMTNKERETGVIPTDVTKFSDSQLKKVKSLTVLDKSQGVFLLKEDLIKNHKDNFGSNYIKEWYQPWYVDLIIWIKTFSLVFWSITDSW